jgi:hypothetical protein
MRAQAGRVLEGGVAIRRSVRARAGEVRKFFHSALANKLTDASESFRHAAKSILTTFLGNARLIP